MEWAQQLAEVIQSLGVDARWAFCGYLLAKAFYWTLTCVTILVVCKWAKDLIVGAIQQARLENQYRYQIEQWARNFGNFNEYGDIYASHRDKTIHSIDRLVRQATDV